MVKKKQKRDWKRFWTEMNPQTKTNILKFTGLAIAAFALFTLVCVISYLMTWSQDQSLSITSVYKEAKLIKNTGNYFGYNWSRFLVQDCFGLGSFALVVLLGLYAWKLFFRNITFIFICCGSYSSIKFVKFKVGFYIKFYYSCV